MNNKFWSDDISILFRKDRFTQFFPSENMTLEEKLNSLTRLGIYTSAVLFLYNRNYKVLYASLGCMLLTYIIYKNTDKEKVEEDTIDNFEDLDEQLPFLEKKQKIVDPSINNPFTNILLTEYEENPNRESNIDIEDDDNKKDIENKFEFNLYKDINDIYNTNNSQRQFYTNPITTIPNKQREFANWCYKTPKTCKEGNGFQCTSNNYTPLDGSSRLPMI